MISTVEGNFYLILSRKTYTSWKLAGRLSVGTPSLKAGEVAVRLDVSLPLSLFQRPALSAKISVPDSGVPKADITAEVMDNVAAVLSDQLGMTVRVSMDDM